MSDKRKDRQLRPDQVAKKLNVSRRQVYYLIGSGDLPSTKISPRCTRITESALKEFMKKKSGKE